MAGGSFSSWPFCGREAPGLSAISRCDCVFASPALVLLRQALPAPGDSCLKPGDVCIKGKFMEGLPCHSPSGTQLVLPGIFGRVYL